MIKIIAIGNRLMQDDGVAIAVAENLRDKLELMGLEVIIAETDFQFCFHLLKEDDFVTIIDATCTDAEPGTVHTFELKEAACAYCKTGSQHEISILDLMRLYSKPLKGYLIGIEIAETEFGFELSEFIKSKFNNICFEVERTIHKIVRGKNESDYLKVDGKLVYNE